MRGVRTSSRPRARTSTGPLTSQIHCEPLAQSRLGLSSTHEAGPQQSEPTQERTGEMVQQQSTRDAERRARPDSVRNGRTSPRVPVFLDLRGIWPPSRWSELPVGQPAQAGGTGRRPPAPPQSLGPLPMGSRTRTTFGLGVIDPVTCVIGRQIRPNARTHRPRRNPPTGRPVLRGQGRDGLGPYALRAPHE